MCPPAQAGNRTIGTRGPLREALKEARQVPVTAGVEELTQYVADHLGMNRTYRLTLEAAEKEYQIYKDTGDIRAHTDAPPLLS